LKNWKKWISLFAGSAFFVFSNGRFACAFAAWIAPTLLLNFTREEKKFRRIMILPIVTGICTQISFWGFSSRNPQNILFYLPFLMGLVLSIPYFADRLLCKHFAGVIQTLIFPAAYTAVEFLYVRFSPLGSTGSLAYSQTEFTSLVQIASVTGIYGITFMITWFSSVAAEVCLSGNIKTIQKPMLAYFTVLTLVLSFGAARLLIPDHSQTVRVSGISVYDLRSEKVQSIWDHVKTDPGAFQAMSNQILSDFIGKTKTEAASGSKIVVWSEISPMMLYDDQQAYIKKIENAAKESHVIIVAAPYILSRNLHGRDTNELLIVNSDGSILLQHMKYGGAMFDNIVKGNQILHSAASPYGRLSGVICWDADYPSVMRQEGAINTDILLSPAADWKNIDPIHSAPAYFRGIENGVSVLRQTVNGLSFASDAEGRYLAKMDYYTSSDRVLVAQLPTRKTVTLYPIIGDAFAVGDMIFLIFIIVFSIGRSQCGPGKN
jgi:apolipoprotein N-acyltransferase